MCEAKSAEHFKRELITFLDVSSMVISYIRIQCDEKDRGTAGSCFHLGSGTELGLVSDARGVSSLLL